MNSKVSENFATVVIDVPFSKERLANLLKRRREELKLTQRQMAQKMFLNADLQSWVSQLENGYQVPAEETREKICRAYKLDKEIVDLACGLKREYTISLSIYKALTVALM